MSDLKIKLGLFAAEGHDSRPWTPMVRFWAFLWRWTGHGYPWIIGTNCALCGAPASDVEFQMERMGHGKLRCLPDYECEANMPANESQSGGVG